VGRESVLATRRQVGFAIVSKRSLDELRDNFSYSLLEYWSMRVDDEHVLQREA
jgi:hypothetical protein